MKPDDQADLAAFLGEMQLETDRGLPLVVAALIDEKLRETLQSFFCDVRSPVERLLTERNAPLGTLAARADACLALGLIEASEHETIGLIRKIRNEFAHARHGLTFLDQKIDGLCGTLKVEVPGGAELGPNQARTRFTYAAMDLVLRLFYRGRWVALERRVPKIWIDAGEMRWRTMDEPIPEGRTVLLRSKAGLALGGVDDPQAGTENTP